ncbi:MAG: 5-(carboxyamino)imidazole ribonucleotide synthase [Sphingorhabdus sp.]
MSALSPGSTIGILGGGQLGRMLAIAAAQLGYRCHIFAPDENCVAAEVAAEFTCASFDSINEVSAFAAKCEVITYEFENVPVPPLERITDKILLRPSTQVLKIAQSRLAEKNFVGELGGKTVNFAEVPQEISLEEAISIVGFPAILKTNRMGYDGKGQLRVSNENDLANAWRRTGGQPLIAEAAVEFDAEFSVILVRSAEGEVRYWQSPKNVHEDGMLARSSLPAGPLIESQQAEARQLSASIADELDYVGVFTTEFFATSAGPVFNEMAPRVHNSGHWTIEGAVTSQFENHIRAICGLPLGDTGLTSERMEMENIIGDKGTQAAVALAEKDKHLHLYGKREAREGRKMGHLTRLYR